MYQRCRMLNRRALLAGFLSAPVAVRFAPVVDFRIVGGVAGVGEVMEESAFRAALMDMLATRVSQDVDQMAIDSYDPAHQLHDCFWEPVPS
jgi:hypothetical protein